MPATLNDESPMPFGKHKGQPLSEVPASYLLWLWDNDTGLWQDDRERNAPLKRYIEFSWETLLMDQRDYIAQHPPKGKPAGYSKSR